MLKFDECLDGNSSYTKGCTLFYAAVAHQVEQQTENLCVAGSSPARGTMFLKFAPVTELVYVLVLETKF